METKLYYRIVANDCIVMRGRIETMEKAEIEADRLLNDSRFREIRVELIKEESVTLRTFKRKPLYKALWEE